MRNAVAAALAAVLGMGTAHAGDLHEVASLKDMPAPVGCVTCWGGLFVGSSAGFGVGDTEHQRGDFIENYFPEYFEMSGQLLGLYVDYNFTNGPIVFGVEGSINATNMDGHYTGSRPDLGNQGIYFTHHRYMDWYATLTGRVGYAVGNIMAYSFAGGAWTKMDSTFASYNVETNVTTTHEDDSNHFGWTAGVGLEWAMDPCWVARVEYSHVDFDDERIFEDSGHHHDTTLDFDAIKIGVSYKLRGREDRIVEMPMK